MTQCTYKGIRTYPQLKPLKASAIDPGLVIYKTSKMFGVPVSEIKSSSRMSKVAEARRVAISITRELTTLTLKEIGAIFNRDHSTIIHSIDTNTGILSYDKRYKVNYEILKADLCTP